MEPTPIRPRGYIPRLADNQVERYLKVFGAVEVAGTKWCGKTWTARAHGQSLTYVDQILPLAQEDPHAALVGDAPHVVDEWQLVPRIWDAVRHEVDETRGLRGGWILTGSSTPFPETDPDKRPAHSGAGRIGRIRMYPMTLAESGDSVGSISLAGLFRGEFKPRQIPTDARDLVGLVCRGGWPEAVDLPATDAQLIARNYLQLLCDDSVRRHGKNPATARRLLFSLARTVGQATSYRTLIQDMADASGDIGVSEPTLVGYLGLLRRLYVLEEIPGWLPPARSAKRVNTKPKRYLADPSLVAAALGLGEQGLLEDWQTFGSIFENLCIRDLLVYTQALPECGDVPLRYYRDDTGLEIDAIVELADHRWAAFEIKTGEVKVPEAIANLKRLRNKLTKNPAAQVRPPEFMAVLTGIGSLAYEAEEGIYVIPIRAFGA